MSTAASTDPKTGNHPEIQRLFNIVRARFGLIHVVSSEEERIMQTFATWQGLSAKARRLYSWSMTEGLLRYGSGPHEDRGRDDIEDEDLRSPTEAIRKILGVCSTARHVYFFRDLHHHGEDPELIRLLRDAARKLRESGSVMLFISPRLFLPTDIEREVAVVDFPLPSPDEIGGSVDKARSGVPEKFRGVLDAAVRSGIIRACSGMTKMDIDDAIAMAVIEQGGFGPGVVTSINKHKRGTIRRSECLEVVDAPEGLSDIGGLDRLKDWLKRRRNAFSDEAQAFGVEPPRGMLTLGVPGGGKGLSAKAVANEWQVQLLRLDFSSIFGSLVGQSESNLREALKVAEAVAPCVLWIDEIEKAFAGGASGGSTDGGTTSRVFGSLLTWLQERQAPVFTYFTGNDVSSLPPELLRKGRVDEIFFIDLPNEDERRAIFEIHLRRRGRDPSRYDLDALARESRGCVGAEIEAAVREGVVDAWDDKCRTGDADRDVETRDIVEATRRTVPMVKSQRGKIDKLLSWVESGRAVRASSGDRVVLDDAFFDGGIAGRSRAGEGPAALNEQRYGPRSSTF